MGPNLTFESAGAPADTREPLRVAALTVWTHSGPRVVSASELERASMRREAVRPACTTGPVWLDLQLDTDVQKWMQPWEPLGAHQTDWSPALTAVVAAGLAPPGAGERSEQLIMRHLHVINEYGVLRWLTTRGHPDDGAALVMPLVGFIPGDSLATRDGSPAAGLEFVLLRVNLAVVGDWLVTIRLTDRLCSGCRERPSGYRLRADEFYESPNLSLFNRFLPATGVPTATDLGDALASYLAATCSTATESARERLRVIERHFVDAALERPDDAAIADCHAEMLAIRATLETVGEELLRLSQRLSDVEDSHSALARARNRYDDALRQLDSVEAEIRWASDAATNQLTTRRVMEERAAEQDARDRQKTLERVIAGLGTALVIAALVPSLFGESAKLPTGRAADFIGMVLMMLGTSGVVFWALIWLLNTTSATNDKKQRGQRRWITVAAGFNLVAAATLVAGILVLLMNRS